MFYSSRATPAARTANEPCPIDIACLVINKKWHVSFLTNSWQLKSPVIKCFYCKLAKSGNVLTSKRAPVEKPHLAMVTDVRDASAPIESHEFFARWRETIKPTDLALHWLLLAHGNCLLKHPFRKYKSHTEPQLCLQLFIINLECVSVCFNRWRLSTVVCTVHVESIRAEIQAVCLWSLNYWYVVYGNVTQLSMQSVKIFVCVLTIKSLLLCIYALVSVCITSVHLGAPVVELMWLSACDQSRLVTYCALDCAMTGNNPLLTQHQLIVSTHFIKRKWTAFTSAEAAALKPTRHGQQEADTKRLFKEDVCTVCPLLAYCTSTLYQSCCLWFSAE